MKFLLAIHFIFTLVESHSPVVTQLTKPVALSEGPFWDNINQKLYYVDIDGKALYRLDPVTKEEHVLHLDRTPSFVIPVRGQEFRYILGLDRDLVVLTWYFPTDFYTTCLLVSLDPGRPGNRLNEAKADAWGRVWAGSKGPADENNLSPPDEAAFYRVDATRPYRVFADVVLSPVSISNGLIWSLDNKFLYYIDSPLRRVDVFRFNLQLGTISGRETVFRFDDHNLQGIPDGLTIDSDGTLYVTVNGGGQVVKFNACTGEILQTIHIPVSHVTSVEFGGLAFDVLFVTTMKSKTVGVPSEPQAGAVFTVTGLNVTGLPSNRAVINGQCTPFHDYWFYNHILNKRFAVRAMTRLRS